MRKLRIAVLVVLLVAGLFSLVGLTAAYFMYGRAKPKYAISGTVTRDGKALEWKADNRKLDVKFVPLDRVADDNVYSAETDTDAGTYTIAAIPPGSYRVSIQQMDPFPTHDLLNFALSMSGSTIRRDVTKNGEVIDIDIPKVLPRKGK
jgi:hypothetical protein